MYSARLVSKTSLGSIFNQSRGNAMWPFSSSSSPNEPSTSASSSTSATPTTAPNREQRAACWKARDEYFDCLIKNRVTVPGEEGPGVCKGEVKVYEQKCGKTWMEHFNKRKETELKQQALIGYRPPTPGR
ncbi:cytochrome oxidase c subunit VIb-domain-containing protein [Kockovaella imperatae]|uniref:Cytochrome oxidase c subunit VIb-domain-containing protein n=1 Tax=Kockovaella imperatae TaxID=4999 RepID=A0A1Y1U810_9TREE|nr:cytochrome oxidase c subunit VIb-domain-containing protein [Kockovaella imperatae]ORX34171.1 cytochrome oxidase c subunit VIb-domain-containing protein [Kockovaella imperatae]